jgi:hypothetical protein
MMQHPYSKTLFPQAIKLQFYDMMVQYGLRHHAYLDVAKYYHKVWETPSIKEDVNGKGKTVRYDSLLYASFESNISPRRLNTSFTTLLFLLMTTNSLT